jgi:hypothetical protein
MGFMDKLRGELIDIIEWLDDSRDTMVWRFPRYQNEIKMGAKLVVRESQTAVFVNEGQVADVFMPGTSAVPYAIVPAEWSSHELDATLSRGAPNVLATTITAAWTLTSASVDPSAILRLQMWAVAFDPALNADNAAGANRSFTIPVTVTAQPGSAVSTVDSLAVSYSTNDGATWRPATVASTGSRP